MTKVMGDPSRDGQYVKSILFGDNNSYPITQDFAEYNDATASMYAYSAQYGFPPGWHIGMDLGTPQGTPIRALSDGTVEYAGYTGFFRPRPVAIIAKDGSEQIYGHMLQDAVSAGNPVKQGDLLGYSGYQTEADIGSARTSGDHIHLEVRKNGVAIDPMDYLLGGSAKNAGSGSETSQQSTPGSGVGGGDIGELGKRIAIMSLGIGLVGIGLAALFPNQAKLAGKAALL